MRTASRLGPTTVYREPSPPLLAVLHEDGDACPELRAGVCGLGFQVLHAAFEQAWRRLRGRRWSHVEAVFIVIRADPAAGLRLLWRIRRRDWALPVVVVDRQHDRVLGPDAERLGATAIVRHEREAIGLAREALGPVRVPPSRHGRAPAGTLEAGHPSGRLATA